MSQTKIPGRHQIFCNRSLNMKVIRAVGFDMDYTLALYRPEKFEVLAYEETLKKLVGMGYTEDILKWEFDYKHIVRGLVIDKPKGNVFKMDRHRYVKVACHGLKEIPRDERKALYDASKGVAYDEPDFTLVDTLFTLADAYLFSQLVDLKDANPDTITKNYTQIYRDVRTAIDLCHRDGSIKDRVMKAPWDYIERDPHLIETLERIRTSGRKLFVVTNSLWDYTHSVMNYLFGNDTTTLTDDWTNMFDFIITGAAKPMFFMSNQPIYEIDLHTGFLKNTNGILGDAKIYQGGNFKDLHKSLGIESGSQILYVGDHIYGDILRSKKEIGWRTMLVVEELDHEVEMLEKHSGAFKKIEALMHKKDEIEDALENEIFIREDNKIKGKKATDNSKKIEELTESRTKTKSELRKALSAYHNAFHPVWGQLMKTGYQNSRFAAQLENYACLYTSRFSNFRFVPPSKNFRSVRDLLPHDHI